MAQDRRVREMALPATALVTLRRSLRTEAGPLPTVHALHAAGYRAGESMARIFLEGLARPLDELTVPAFWERFRTFWSRRGWGSLVHDDVHPSIGLLRSDDWAEAGEERVETQPSCAFTSGMLASILGEAAEGPVAVLEVRCRARGDDECVFAFGSETRVHDLYGRLLEGDDLKGVLDAL